jgi:hypothetical protein
MATCRDERCGVEVIWLRNDHTGNKAPIEVKTNPKGNITIDRRRGTWHVIVEADGDVPANQRHMSHFATCRFAKAYRKRCPSCKQSPCIMGPACPKPRGRGRPRKAKPPPGSIQEAMF